MTALSTDLIIIERDGVLYKAQVGDVQGDAELPFCLSNGTPANIPINNMGELPFCLSDGTPANITVS